MTSKIAANSSEDRGNIEKDILNGIHEKKLHNHLRGIKNFDAVVLNVTTFNDPESAAVVGETSGVFIVCKVRPLKIHNKVMPSPCHPEFKNNESLISMVISQHPSARSTKSVAVGRAISINPGDVIACYLAEEGPGHKKHKDIWRFDFSKKSTPHGRFDFKCLRGQGKGFDSGLLLGDQSGGQDSPTTLDSRGRKPKIATVDSPLATAGPEAWYVRKRSIDKIKHVILHSTDGSGPAIGTIRRFAKKDITTSYTWYVPKEHPEHGKLKGKKKNEKKNPPCEEYLQYHPEGYPHRHFCHEKHYKGYAAVVKRVFTGIHYAVGPKGEIIQGANENTKTNHAVGYNLNSIGIEIVGKPNIKPGQGATPAYAGMYTEVVLTSVAKLVADICKRRNLPVDRNTIKGHDEVDAKKKKSDPGTPIHKRTERFDWDDFMKRVKQY